MIKRWPDVKGYLEYAEALKLSELAKDKDCLEIGSFYGKSSVCMAESARSVVCIDTFAADESGQTQMKFPVTLFKFLQNIDGYHNIEYYVGKSEDIIPQLPAGTLFDLVFVDGFHEYENVKMDIELSCKYLKPGGILVLHDFGDSCGVPLAASHCGLLPMDGIVMSLAWKIKREK